MSVWLLPSLELRCCSWRYSTLSTEMCLLRFSISKILYTLTLKIQMYWTPLSVTSLEFSTSRHCKYFIIGLKSNFWALPVKIEEMLWIRFVKCYLCSFFSKRNESSVSFWKMHHCSIWYLMKWINFKGKILNTCPFSQDLHCHNQDTSELSQSF